MKVGRCLLVIVIFMSILIIFGNKGFVDYYNLRTKVTALKKANERLVMENEKLKENITLLRTDLRYVEMVARNELGMVKKNDIVYRVIE